MPTRVVKPDAPSQTLVTRELSALPTLPREEAQRMRKAARSFADACLPAHIRQMAQLTLSEDEEMQYKALQFMIKLSLGTAKSNEEIDPPEAEVMGKLVDGKDPVSELEEETANAGDGSGD